MRVIQPLLLQLGASTSLGLKNDRTAHWLITKTAMLVHCTNLGRMVELQRRFAERYPPRGTSMEKRDVNYKESREKADFDADGIAIRVIDVDKECLKVGTELFRPI